MKLPPEERARIAQQALPMVDLTNLADDCQPDDIRELWHAASTPFGTVAAICIWPRFVGLARDQRRNDAEDARAGDILIACVVNFPSGDEAVEDVVAATRAAVQARANEIDMVLPYRAFLAGDEVFASTMIDAVREAAGSEVTLKVILETGALGEPGNIARTSQLAISAGADFIKTSTGKTATSATPEAARVMLEQIKAASRPVGLKPSGGIRTVEDAKIYLDLTDEIMGSGWASRTTFRFGASGLLGDLIAALNGERTQKPSSGY